MLWGLAYKDQTKVIDISPAYLAEIFNMKKNGFNVLKELSERGWIRFDRARNGVHRIMLMDIDDVNFQNTGNSNKLEMLNPSSINIDSDLLTDSEGDNFQNTGNSNKLEKPPRQPKDERANHPAIQAYRSVARIHIPIAWRDEVIAVVGSEQADVQRWTELVRAWIGRGYNRQNVVGLLDAYKNGNITGRNGHKPAPSAPKDPDLAYLRDNPKAMDRQDVIRALQSRGTRIPFEVLLPAERATLQGAKP